MFRIGNLKIRNWVYVLAIPVLVLYTLILTGCISTSPGVPNIFVGEFQYTALQNDTITPANSTTPITRVRFGYFGICTTSNVTFSCASSKITSPAALSTTLSIPTSTISYVMKLQHTISYTIPSSGSILFLVGLTTLSILSFVIKSQKKSLNPKTKRVKHLASITRLLLWGSTTVTLIAAYCVTSTLSALQIVTSLPTGHSESEDITRGSTLEVLEWMTFGFSVLFSLCVDIMLHPSGDPDWLVAAQNVRRSPFKPVILGDSRSVF